MSKAGTLALSLVAAVMVVGCGLNTSPGTGQKVGQIVKVSKQGMLRDTWEAQLIRGGMNDGSGAFGTVPFDFTIERDEDAARAIQFMEAQTEVVVKYQMEGVYSLMRTESNGRFLVSIEPAR